MAKDRRFSQLSPSVRIEVLGSILDLILALKSEGRGRTAAGLCIHLLHRRALLNKEAVMLVAKKLKCLRFIHLIIERHLCHCRVQFAVGEI